MLTPFRPLKRAVCYVLEDMADILSFRPIKRLRFATTEPVPALEVSIEPITPGAEIPLSEIITLVEQHEVEDIDRMHPHVAVSFTPLEAENFISAYMDAQHNLTSDEDAENVDTSPSPKAGVCVIMQSHEKHQ